MVRPACRPLAAVTEKPSGQREICCQTVSFRCVGQREYLDRQTGGSRASNETWKLHTSGYASPPTEAPIILAP
jgi:hypothetical protein